MFEVLFLGLSESIPEKHRISSLPRSPAGTPEQLLEDKHLKD